jgi:hypothetical protein
MPYILLEGFFNAHVPTEDKNDDTNRSFYEKPVCVFDKFDIFCCESSVQKVYIASNRHVRTGVNMKLVKMMALG